MTIHDAQILHAGRAKTCFDGAKSCLKRPRVPGPRNMNIEDAIQQYQHAQTSFRIIHEWEEAAECMKKSAELMWKMGDKHEAMITLSDCADLLERGNIFDSVEVYKMLISWACDLGRYFDAGRYQQRIAEMLEEGRNLEDAFDAYRHAAHFYSADVKTQHAHHCMVRYATLAADLEDYDVGMEALLELATHCLRESNLTKFNARQFFLQAGLILLAQGHTEELSKQLVAWNVLEMGFINSREHAFLSAMIRAHRPDVMDRRLDTFADDLYDFDTVCPLSSWALRMLRRFSAFVQEDHTNDADRKDAKRKADAAEIARKKAEMKVFMLQGTVKAKDEVEAEGGEEDEEEGEAAGEGGEEQEGEGAEEEEEEEDTQQAEEEDDQLLPG